MELHLFLTKTIKGILLPDDGKRKKAVVQQPFSHAWLECGGFEQIKAAVLYALILTTPWRWRDRRPTEGAAMKQRAFRQIKTVYALSKKARPRLRGQAAMSMYYTM